MRRCLTDIPAALGAITINYDHSERFVIVMLGETRLTVLRGEVIEVEGALSVSRVNRIEPDPEE